MIVRTNLHRVSLKCSREEAKNKEHELAIKQLNADAAQIKQEMKDELRKLEQEREQDIEELNLELGNTI